MDNKNENDRGDVDIGAWNKMCTTVSDVRKILRAPPPIFFESALLFGRFSDFASLSYW